MPGRSSRRPAAIAHRHRRRRHRHRPRRHAARRSATCPARSPWPSRPMATTCRDSSPRRATPATRCSCRCRSSPTAIPNNDPGPHTLTVAATADANLDRLHWLMSRLTTYVGVDQLYGRPLHRRRRRAGAGARRGRRARAPLSRRRLVAARAAPTSSPRASRPSSAPTWCSTRDTEAAAIDARLDAARGDRPRARLRRRPRPPPFRSPSNASPPSPETPPTAASSSSR